MSSQVISSTNFDSKVEHQGVLVRKHHAVVVPSMSNYKTIEASPSVSSTIFASGGVYNMRTKFNMLNKPKNLWLRFTITESGGSNNMVLTDSAHFIQKIEFISSGNNIVYTSYGDCLYWEDCVLPPEESISKKYRQWLNVSDKYYETSLKHGASQQREYRVPMLSTPLHDEFVGDVDNEFNIRITTRNGIVATGSGTVQLDNLRLEIEHEELSQSDTAYHHSLLDTVQVKKMLQPVHVQVTGQSLTASTKLTIDLDQLQADVAFLLIMIRDDSYSSTNSTDKSFRWLGHDATIDLENSSGESLYGGGTAVPADFFLEPTYSSHGLNTKFSEYRACYLMPFCDNVRSAYGGLQRGYFTFDGSKYRLAITPGAAGTDSVQTVNLNNAANDGGYYKLQQAGHVTDSLAYNANAAGIKSALEALPVNKQAPYGPRTVTASGAATTDFTLTFDNEVGGGDMTHPEETVQLITETLNDGGISVAPEFSSTTITTDGKDGWSNMSSNATIDIYAYAYRDVFKKGGRFKAKAVY